jgi:hypothetical protein
MVIAIDPISIHREILIAVDYMEGVLIYSITFHVLHDSILDL